MHQYLNVLAKALHEGRREPNRTGIDALVIRPVMMEFDMADGFPAVTTKKLAFNACKGEFIGFMQGKTSAADFRALGCNFWDQNANENKAWLANPNRKGTDDLGNIYGAVWRNWAVPDNRVQPYPRLREGLEKTYLSVANGKGSHGHPLGKTWEGMIARCYDQNSISYPLYGMRGVYVADRWLEFSAFAEDAVSLPGWDEKSNSIGGFEYQLDKDTIGTGYEYGPGRCQWLSASDNNPVNAQRKRLYVVEKDGQEFSFFNVKQFCDEQGVEAKNFSDLWTGSKNAKTRGGFKLVRVEDREPKGIDQVIQALDTIRRNPTSRDIVINAWNPAELDRMALRPCHVAYQFIVDTHRRELSLSLWQRSGDIFLGIPINIASCGLMLSFFAALTGLRPRFINHYISIPHLYVNHVEQANIQLDREPLPLPKIGMSIPKLGMASDAEIIASLTPASFWLEPYESHAALAAPMAV